MSEAATMPPPARLGHEFNPQQDAPPAHIQKNIEKAMAEKDAVLEKSSKGFLAGLQELGDEPRGDQVHNNDGRSNTQKVEKEPVKAGKKPAKTAEDITKAPEQGVAQELSADPMEALEQLTEAETTPEAKETAKEEVTTEEKPEPTDPKEKERYQWGKLKAKAEEYDKKIQEWTAKEQDFQKQITEREERLKSLQEKEKRAEELEKKIEEYRVKVAKADILEDPEYQSSFVQPYEETMGFLKQAADAYQLNWPSLVQIMETASSDVERNKAFAGLIADSDSAVDTVTQSQMAAAMMDINKLRQYDKQLKENSVKAWEAMQLEKESKTKAEQEKTVAQRREDARAAFRRMQKSIAEMQDANEDEWVNDLAMAEHPPALRAAQAYALKTLPMVIQKSKEAIKAKDAEIERLNGIIKARSNGGPKMEPGGSGGLSNGSHLTDDKRSFAERLAGA
jgi:hypothetical protein